MRASFVIRDQTKTQPHTKPLERFLAGERKGRRGTDALKRKKAIASKKYGLNEPKKKGRCIKKAG